MIRLPLGQGVHEFMELQFKAGIWDARGIPERGCRIRKSQLEQLLVTNGMGEPDDLILGLMDWIDVTDDPQPSLIILQRLLDRHYPPDSKTEAPCRFVNEHGCEQIFHAGPIDLKRPLVAWQRRQWLIAAAQPSVHSGRMTVGAPAPISLQTAQAILGHSITKFMGSPHDSFQGVQSAAGRTGSVYAWHDGRVTPTRWDDGLVLDEVQFGCGSGARGRGWLAPAHLAIQVAIAGGY